jgi:hypothetical protein
MGKLLKITLPDKPAINSFDLSKLDPTYCLVSCLDSGVRLIDTNTGSVLADYKEGHV